MTTFETILKEATHHGDELHIDFWYPDTDNADVRKFVIGLMDVRASDKIRVSYDKDRDGWVIEQASMFSWDADDTECDEDWQEVHFVKSWARAKQYQPCNRFGSL